MSAKVKTTILCVVLICVAGVLWTSSTSNGSLPTLSYSQFLEKVRTGEVASVVVMGGNSGAVQAICRLRNGDAERTVLPPGYRDALMAMEGKSVDVEIRDSSSGPREVVMKGAPFLVPLGVWVILLIGGFPKGRVPLAWTR
jgi:ATP-dependent Zn protease